MSNIELNIIYAGRYATSERFWCDFYQLTQFHSITSTFMQGSLNTNQHVLP